MEKLNSMKKKQQKTVVKEQKKAAKKALKSQIVDALSVIGSNLGADKKIQRIIEKSAKQLAEKLTVFANTPVTEAAPVIEEKTAKAPTDAKKTKVATTKKKIAALA